MNFFFFFSFLFSLVFVCIQCICVLRSPCCGTGTRQRCMATSSHCRERAEQRSLIWKPHEYCMLPKQVFPICRQEEEKKNGPLFKKTLVSFFFFLLFCLPCICFCIITVYGFCIKCIRVLGCKWNFIHILSKYLL